VPDAVNPKFGVWTFRTETPPTNNTVLGTAPSKLRAVLTDVAGATASAEIDTTLR
jgi:hypothetical protein